MAALYLAMTSWYGHEDKLELIAANALTLHPNGRDFHRAAQATGFDLANFSAMVRYAIALKRTGMAPGAQNQ